MSSATMNGNARAERKSLAGQIDRLDSILDGLSENLEAAVADSVRGAAVVAVTEAVTEAVQVAVREVLSNPELMRLMLARHESKRRPLRDRLAGVWRRLWDGASSAVGSVWGGVTGVAAWCVEAACARSRGLRDAARGAADRLAIVNEKVRLAFFRLWLLRRCCAIALAVGVVCGLFCQVCGPTAASLVGGLSSALLTLGGLAVAPFWGALRRSGWLG